MGIQALFSKKFLGIDIGTSTIKLVELGSFAGRIRLENYGGMYARVIYQKKFRTLEKNTILFGVKDISRIIRAICQEAGIKTKRSFFSIPDFVTFFTTFELPPMTAQEVPQAVSTEARRHVPMPIDEVTIDWQLVGGKPAGNKRIRVLLAAVPNEIISQYQQVAELSGLKLLAMEAEVFSLTRALVRRGERGVIGLIDIGAQTTTCNVVDSGVLKISHSFDTSGDDLTERIIRGLDVEEDVAEGLKREYGVSPSLPQVSPESKDVREILLPIVDVILRESEKIFNNFALKEGKNVDKIIIAGGGALLPGLLLYFQNHFKTEVEMARPFSRVVYPRILGETLREIGPTYAVALGMALKGFE